MARDLAYSPTGTCGQDNSGGVLVCLDFPKTLDAPAIYLTLDEVENKIYNDADRLDGID
jgi:hypothetical protein